MSGVYPLEKNLSNDSLTTPLYFGLMVAPSEDSTYLNTTVTAVQLALDTINTNIDLLKGYSLHYTLTVSKVWQFSNVQYFVTLETTFACDFSIGTVL